jgi:acyl-CoA synthetase (AMP-forming)/AMP-acid ligase II
MSERESNGGLTVAARLRPHRRTPPARAAHYVEQGHWNNRRLDDGIEAAGSSSPLSIGLVDNRRSLTWADLSRLVSAGVSRLGEVGVSAHDPVLLVAGNSVEGVIAYHSLLRAGAPAILLDRRCGPADVRGAIDAVEPRMVIVPQRERDRLQAEFGALPVLMLEEFVDGESATHSTGSEPDRDEVAVVLFTSGTTSRPKGVTHSINTLTAGASNMALITETDSKTTIFLVSPLTSITGVMQMHLAADQHAVLILEDSFDAQTSLDRIVAHKATLLGGAPVIVEHLVKSADARRDHRLPLRTLALGGSMLPRPLLQRLMDEHGIKVARVYGSSEAPNATGSLPADSAERRIDDDGALMPGTEVRVGSKGDSREGLLRGPAVFLGYLDESDNGAAFEDDWYRTGDLVEVLDGRLTVVGRLKEVVNRNGIKISLPEVDAALFGLPDLEEWASFALPDATTGERLAVAVLPKSGCTTSLDAIVAYLRSVGTATRQLPEQVVVWDEPLPRTASGKIIRSRLVMDTPAKVSMVVDRLRSNELPSPPIPTTTEGKG